MIWRPWVIVALGLGMVLFNAVLIVQEYVPTPMLSEKLERVNNPLTKLAYKANNRRSTLLKMGFKPDVADLIGKDIERIVGSKEAWRKVLEAQAGDLQPVFCAGPNMAQPYRALPWLTTEENDLRYSLESIGRARKLERAPWFDGGGASDIYAAFELTKNRTSEATVMGVGALLGSFEEEALDGRAPFDRRFGGSYGYDNLISAKPRLKKQIQQYFALMYFLTEIANDANGICRD